MPNKRIIFHNPKLYPDSMHSQTSKLPVGWCNYNKHRGKLSVKQLKHHKCISKQCHFLYKNMKHPYWEQRERIKQIKQDKKKQSKFEEIVKEELRKALDKI